MSGQNENYENNNNICITNVWNNLTQGYGVERRWPKYKHIWIVCNTKAKGPIQKALHSSY